MFVKGNLPTNASSNHPQNLGDNLQKLDRNKILVLLIILNLITLGAAIYIFYQYYQLKKHSSFYQSKIVHSPNPVTTASPQSNFEYTYITPEEYKQKMTAFLTSKNKNNKNFQINKIANLVETATKEYENLDEFTKHLISICPSSFSPENSGSYTPLENISELPFVVKGSHKTSCVVNLFSPHLSHFLINFPTTNYENPIESSHIFVMGNKSTSGDVDEYLISASDVLGRIDQLPTINGVKIEVKSKELTNNETGKLDGHLTLFYSYKKTSYFLIGGISSIKEESNSNFKNLKLDQYPNIDPKYKATIDQLTEIVTSIRPR